MVWKSVMGNAGCSLIRNILKGVWKQCLLKGWKWSRNGQVKITRKVRKENGETGLGRGWGRKPGSSSKKANPRKREDEPEHLPTPMASWFPVVWCKPNCTQPSQLWLEGEDHRLDCSYPTKTPGKLKQSLLTSLLERNNCLAGLSGQSLSFPPEGLPRFPLCPLTFSPFLFGHGVGKMLSSFILCRKQHSAVLDFVDEIRNKLKPSTCQ